MQLVATIAHLHIHLPVKLPARFANFLAENLRSVYVARTISVQVMSQPQKMATLIHFRKSVPFVIAISLSTFLTIKLIKKFNHFLSTALIKM